MKRKGIILSIIIVIFIAVNIFLVVNDHSHKVDRLTFISDWTEAEEKEMQETLHKDGVLESAFENYIYLDDSLGSFNEFLVEEGNRVKAGEDLYAYDVHQPYEMLLQLQQREDELTESIDAIERAISQIGRTDITQEEFNFVYPDDTEAGTFRQNVSNAKMVKDQYMIEKEKELAEKQAELSSIEIQVEDLQTGEETITVESPYAGRVTDIDSSLKNPLMTIEKLELYAVGELSEKERMEIETGMLAEITLKENHQRFDGSVIDIDDDPKQLKLEGKSIYPFYVQLGDLFEDEGVTDPIEDEESLEDDTPETEFEIEEEEEAAVESFDEEGEVIDLEDAEDDFDEDLPESDDELTEEELLQGYHADVKIILEENPAATAVSEKLVQKNKVWVMTGNGQLIHEPVDTGITDSGDVEITSDVIEEGDWLALEPRQQFRDESQFITPLKPSRTSWKAIYDDGARKRSILIGLLGR